jgi:hypothetical protein
MAGGIALFLLCAAAPTHAQDSTATPQTAETQGADWTVVEYPEGQEIVVELTPTALHPGARGTARVTRSGEQAAINLDVTGLDGDATGYHLYAVSHEGRVVPLGAVPTSGGAGTYSTSTGFSRFMLILSPTSDLNALDAATPVALRSAVPDGLVIVSRTGGAAAEETTVNTGADPDESAPNDAADEVAEAYDESEYDVPLLGINSFRRGAETQLRSHLTGDLSGTRTAVYVKPLKGGVTQVKVRFQNLREPEDGARYVLWAVAPDKTYTRLGQVEKPDRKQSATIEARTILRDFGLLITTERNAATLTPSGRAVAMAVR